MQAFKQVFLSTIINVFLINHCNSKNNKGTFYEIQLNNNEMSYGDTHAARCNRGQLMDLISYKFENNLTEDDFSDTEELELYQKCSMQEKCTNLRVPSRLAQNTNTSSYAAIKFQCIDPKTSNIMDMCDNRDRSFNDTLHLMFNDSATVSITKCECHIDGKFSVILNDVRIDVKNLMLVHLPV